MCALNRSAWTTDWMLCKWWKTLGIYDHVCGAYKLVGGWPCLKEQGTGLPLTAFRSSKQTALCCFGRKLSRWWAIRKSGNKVITAGVWYGAESIEPAADASIAGKVMSKMRDYGFSHEQGVTWILITGYMTSGVKLAGTYHGRLYGTREVITAP